MANGYSHKFKTQVQIYSEIKCKIQCKIQRHIPRVYFLRREYIVVKQSEADLGIEEEPEHMDKTITASR